MLSTLVLAGCGGGGSSGGSSTVAAIQCVAPEPLVFPGASVTGPSINGIIEIEANARVDKDTAELELGQTTLTRVERLPSAVILGGYLSGVSGIYEDDFGAPTEFTYPSDSQDRFCIDLEPGQQVTVEFFGPEAGNRIRLLRASDGEVLSSAGFNTSGSKQVTLPETAADGTYVIDLQAQDQAGPFRYVLTSSPTGTGNAQNLDWAPGEFVPGEAVVTVSGSGGFSAQSVPFSAQMVMERALGNNQQKVVMPAAVMAQAQSLADQKRQTIDWVRELRKRPDVVSASPNYLFRSMVAFEAVNEPLYPDQWHYPLINLPQAWQLAPEGGNGVNVAVLDTGLFRFEGEWHEDLKANLPATCAPTTCADFVDDVLPPEDPGSALGGSVYHGTHVAGTIAASGINGRGGAGVAPSAKILPVRVLDENGSGTLADIVEAIDWSVDAGAGVINLSLGSPSSPPNLQIAIDAAEAAGVLVVAAAGNSPNADPVYPAAYTNVFGVGAVDGAGVRAGYSNVGSSVDLVAPGGDASRDANQDGRSDVVVSASGNATTGFTYTGLQGTSMATPHVAGVFALMKELEPSLNTSLVKAMLANGELTSSPPTGEPGYGKGLIDAAEAVAAASGNLALLSASPLLIEFSDGSGEEVLSLNRVGDPDQIIQDISVTEGDSWLSASPVASDGDGFSVTVTLDRSQLEPGRAYRSDLTIDYQAGGDPRSLTVPVIVPVESAVAAREAGLHFVLMIDESAQSVAQTVVTSVNGNYSFAFEVIGEAEQPSRANQIVAGGSYYLVAGTDLNNDGFICAAGEACAEYPIAGLREKVEVVLNGDGTASLIDEEQQPIAPEDLVMTTSFSRPLSAQSLPRPGFEGYKLLESAHEYAPRAVAE